MPILFCTWEKEILSNKHFHQNNTVPTKTFDLHLVVIYFQPAPVGKSICQSKPSIEVLWSLFLLQFFSDRIIYSKSVPPYSLQIPTTCGQGSNLWGIFVSKIKKKKKPKPKTNKETTLKTPTFIYQPQYETAAGLSKWKITVLLPCWKNAVQLPAWYVAEIF